MKIPILLLIVSISTNVALSQDNIYNFSVIKNEIVWQKVYDTPLNIEQLDQEIRNSGLFEEIERDGSTFRGSVKDLFPILSGSFFMIVPHFVSSNIFNCYAIIEYKIDKYRVTIKNIVLRSNEFGLEEEYRINTLEHYVFLRGSSQFNNPFTRSGADILDFTFEQKFDFGRIDDEW